jgi:hypothetical protein
MGTNIENTVPISELYKSVSPEKLEASVITSAATQRVISDPLPGPMLDAVANTEVEVITSKGKVILRPIVIYDFTIFKKINSPHYRTMLEGNSGGSLDIEDEELYEMIYQFTHTCKEIRTILKKGREYFRDIATEEIADKYNMDDLKVLLDGVAVQVRKSFSTMVGHGPSEEKSSEDDDIKKK